MRKYYLFSGESGVCNYYSGVQLKRGRGWASVIRSRLISNELQVPASKGIPGIGSHGQARSMDRQSDVHVTSSNNPSSTGTLTDSERSGCFSGSLVEG